MVKTPDTVEIDRNRQSEKYPKGARIAHYIGSRPKSDEQSIKTEDVQRQIVLEAWQNKWGEIPWDRVRISHRYLSFQIATELIVYPEGY